MTRALAFVVLGIMPSLVQAADAPVWKTIPLSFEGSAPPDYALVHGAVEDRNGVLWAQVGDEIFRLKDDGVWSAPERPCSDPVSAIGLSEAGEPWACSHSGCVLRHNGAAWVQVTLPAKEELKSCVVSANRRLFIATNTGALLEATASGVRALLRLPAGASVVSALESGPEEHWFAVTDRALGPFFVHGKGSNSRILTAKSYGIRPSDGVVPGVVGTAAGVVWGKLGPRVGRLDEERWTALRKVNARARMTSDDDGNLWLTDDSNELLQIAPSGKVSKLALDAKSFGIQPAHEPLVSPRLVVLPGRGLWGTSGSSPKAIFQIRGTSVEMHPVPASALLVRRDGTLAAVGRTSLSTLVKP